MCWVTTDEDQWFPIKSPQCSERSSIGEGFLTQLTLPPWNIAFTTAVLRLRESNCYLNSPFDLILQVLLSTTLNSLKSSLSSLLWASPTLSSHLQPHYKHTQLLEGQDFILFISLFQAPKTVPVTRQILKTHSYTYQKKKKNTTP